MNLHLELAERRRAATRLEGVLYIHCVDADEVVAEWRKAGLEVVRPREQAVGQVRGEHVDARRATSFRFGSPRRD